MSVRCQAPVEFQLIGYDPQTVLANEHLARFVDTVVDEVIEVQGAQGGRGRPGYDPRLLLKVLIYGYATGVRSSRQLEQFCREHLAYLYLTRGEAPSYRTLCSARVTAKKLIEAVWVALFEVAAQAGWSRVGRLVVDSTKLRANVSSDSVVEQKEYGALLDELERILAEADEVDNKEERAGLGQEARLEKALPKDQMRDIVRRARRLWARAQRGEAVSEPGPSSITAPMYARVREAKETIEQAQKEGAKHVSLTDPDAKMMPAGRDRKIHPCHSFEVAVDGGLLVVGQSTQEGNDNVRLPLLIEAAKAHEPAGVTAVDADGGYYSGDLIAELLIKGFDLCVPDSHTSKDLQRGLPVGTSRKQVSGSVSFEYDGVQDVYRCPPGNELRRVRDEKHKGQQVTVYRAVKSCAGCALAKDCMKDPKAKRRTIKRGVHHDELIAHQQRFADPDFRERYRNRGAAVETVFGFLRHTLGYSRWLLRRASRVACEAALMKTAYQMRKVHLMRVGAT